MARGGSTYRGDDPHRLAARTSARHDVMMICAKYAIEMSRERERDRVVAELWRKEFGDRDEASEPVRGKSGSGGRGRENLRP